MRSFVLYAIVMTILPQLSHAWWKHDGGWFYTDVEKCQRRCDTWYGYFRIAGTTDPLNSVAKGKIYGKFKCICHASREVCAAVKLKYGDATAAKYRKTHFYGRGNSHKSSYPLLSFVNDKKS